MACIGLGELLYLNVDNNCLMDFRQLNMIFLVGGCFDGLILMCRLGCGVDIGQI